ncbi:MAG: CopG family transcriptional regulator [Nitrospinota bacterium]
MPVKKENGTKSELFRKALRKYIDDKQWLKIRQWGLKTSQELGVLTEEDVDKLIHQHRKEKN